MTKRNPAQRFRDEMKKLGLGVTIQLNDEPLVVVTQWTCPDCNGKREISPENKTGTPCPECGSETSAVLVSHPSIEAGAEDPVKPREERG